MRVVRVGAAIFSNASGYSASPVLASPVPNLFYSEHNNVVEFIINISPTRVVDEKNV